MSTAHVGISTWPSQSSLMLQYPYKLVTNKFHIGTGAFAPGVHDTVRQLIHQVINSY